MKRDDAGWGRQPTMPDVLRVSPAERAMIRGRIVVLRDGTEVAKFRAKNVVGWHQTDD